MAKAKRTKSINDINRQELQLQSRLRAIGTPEASARYRRMANAARDYRRNINRSPQMARLYQNYKGDRVSNDFLTKQLSLQVSTRSYMGLNKG